VTVATCFDGQDETSQSASQPVSPSLSDSVRLRPSAADLDGIAGLMACWLVEW
jgi:hypothetical protein